MNALVLVLVVIVLLGGIGGGWHYGGPYVGSGIGAVAIIVFLALLATGRLS